jgi:flagellar motility protein MotE (MotC chaperone)
MEGAMAMEGKVTEDRGALEANAGDETQDVFGDAFGEAAELGEKADLSAADDPGKKEEKQAEPAEKLNLKEEQQPGESDEKYEQRYKTLQGIHKKDKETWESERATLLAQVEEAKTAKAIDTKKEPTEQEAKAAADFIDSLTDEQKKQLEEYEQDFDVVSKMEGLKRSQELSKLRKEFQDWKTSVDSRLNETNTLMKPVVAMADEREKEQHFSAIKSGYQLEDGTTVQGHPDFEKYRDDGSLKAWIDSIPSYRRAPYERVYTQGLPHEVIDLLTDFKRENNIPLTSTSQNVVPMNQRRQERKQALTSVTSRRGAVNTGTAIADDYEGAWDEAQNK